jgi:hypothetical protein
LVGVAVLAFLHHHQRTPNRWHHHFDEAFRVKISNILKQSNRISSLLSNFANSQDQPHSKGARCQWLKNVWNHQCVCMWYSNTREKKRAGEACLTA